MHVRRRAEDAKAIHVLSSGLKAGATWARVETLQACRECCGGQVCQCQHHLLAACSSPCMGVKLAEKTSVRVLWACC